MWVIYKTNYRVDKAQVNHLRNSERAFKIRFVLVSTQKNLT